MTRDFQYKIDMKAKYLNDREAPSNQAGNLDFPSALFCFFLLNNCNIFHKQTRFLLAAFLVAGPRFLPNGA